MREIELNLNEILQLEIEINGLIVNKTGEIIVEGILKQNLKIILKYDLTNLGEELILEKKSFEKINNDLIEKYGVENNGTHEINPFIEIINENGEVIERQSNQKFIDYNIELNDLLENKRKKILFPLITKDDLKDMGSTKDNYRTIFKLIN